MQEVWEAGSSRRLRLSCLRKENAGSVANPITSKLLVSAETVPGVPPASKGKAGKKKGNKKPFGKKAKFQADSVVLREVNSKEENSVPSAPTDTEVASKEQEENSILSAPTKGDASKES